MMLRISGAEVLRSAESAMKAKTAAVERRKSDRPRLEPLRAALPAGCVLDGEMVIVKNDGLDFDALHCLCIPLLFAKESATSQGL
jgi:hypothetical protein